MISLTDFGDSALLLPLAAGVLLWMVKAAGPRPALAWLLAVLICGGTLVVLKIYFTACAGAGSTLHSPSGHTGMSTLVYGGLAVVVGAELPLWGRWSMGAAGAAVILAIAVSRVVLDAHSVSEVVVGMLVGGATLGGFAYGYLTSKPALVRLLPLAIIAAVLILLLHGSILGSESIWQALGVYFRGHTPICA